MWPWGLGAAGEAARSLARERLGLLLPDQLPPRRLPGGSQVLKIARDELKLGFSVTGVQLLDGLAGRGTSFGFNDPDGNQWRVVEAK